MENGEAYLDGSANPAKLLLTAGYNTSNPIPVPFLSPRESYRTLGVFLSPSGSTKKAYEILLGYSKDYANTVAKSTLTSDH
jgi:hypothetical protein